MTRRGSASARTASRSREVSRLFTPAVIAPSLAAARYDSAYSGPDGRISATTSPTFTPRARMPAATSSDTRSRSAYETVQPPAVMYAGEAPKRRAASRRVAASNFGLDSFASGGAVAASYKSADKGRGDSAGTPAQGRELRAQGKRTMRRLLDAGLRVFAERGYHASRVDDIVRAARTSHGT